MARSVRELKAAVAGTGFIGVVHVEALRRLGVEVLGVVRRPPSARRRRGSLRHTRATRRCSRTSGWTWSTSRRRTISITARRAMPWRPASTSSARSRWRPRRRSPRSCSSLRRRVGSCTARTSTSASIRSRHQARALVASGVLGAVWNVHGGYLQDWLLYPTDWNWRLEPEKGGALRAVADIGSHWMDLAQWVTGRGSSRSSPTSRRHCRFGGGPRERWRRSPPRVTSSAWTRRWPRRTLRMCCSDWRVASWARPSSRR